MVFDTPVVMSSEQGVLLIALGCAVWLLGFTVADLLAAVREHLAQRRLRRRL